MTLLEIPVRSDLPAYVERVDLDGSAYTLRLSYNGRRDRWYLDLMASDGSDLVTGLLLVPDFPVGFRQLGNLPGTPPGRFLLVDETGAARTPGRDLLGNDLRLIYVSGS